MEHPKIESIKPDIIAKCGNELYVIENETQKTLRSKHTRHQINEIKKFKEKNNVNAAIGYNFISDKICYLPFDKKSEKNFREKKLLLCKDITLEDFVK